MDDAIAFLRSKLTAVVSWVAADGKPQSATVFYWVNDVSPGHFSIFFVTRRSTRKFTAMLANPSVAIVSGMELEPVTVQIEGDVTPVDAADGLHSLEELTERLSAQPNLQMLYGGAFFPKNPFGDLQGDDFAVMQVKPTWVRFMRRNADTQNLEFLQVVP
jgi:uncharacterized pyridoxamine 5'-phosphate oxidase family protein